MRLLATILLVLWPSVSLAENTMRMAVTTSFHNSGLADVLLPEIQNDLGLEVQLLIVGTGQAIKLGQAGDVDAILVHSRAAEEAFVAEGYGTHRREVMYNDFVIIGPAADPASVAGVETVTEALQRVAEAEAIFVSRGDDSGTHRKELSLWSSADLDVEAFGPHYRAVGAGMGAALNTAADMNAYILSDRASWLNFGNKADLALLFAGDPVLFNQYSFLPVNAELHPHVNAEAVAALEAWLTGPRAAELINSYTIDGETLFVFNATSED
ncbi:substrate-binding domain-containing protein [Yoonia litorea]|uniref:Tungstate transport system substrate-binding protein n=1 Tax=Yoonia litorea TaxID=1123755 RepID=A0A1I6MW58_9RHOB|nr:substrate-binding domain-containing protein [Yoonia litorea]SFS19936.1 tungstate transport system substrate-binding protein [Yoonia litorea]